MGAQTTLRLVLVGTRNTRLDSDRSVFRMGQGAKTTGTARANAGTDPAITLMGLSPVFLCRLNPSASKKQSRRDRIHTQPSSLSISVFIV